MLRQEIDSREYLAELRFAESYVWAAPLQSFADKRRRFLAQRVQTESERGRQSVWPPWSDDNPKAALMEGKHAGIRQRSLSSYSRL